MTRCCAPPGLSGLSSAVGPNSYGGRIANVSAVVATSVNAEGYREILGLDVLTSEDGAGWTQFLRDLVARGLTGVRLAISDDHRGGGHRGGAAGFVVAKVSDPLRAQPPDQGPARRPAARGCRRHRG